MIVRLVHFLGLIHHHKLTVVGLVVLAQYEVAYAYTSLRSFTDHSSERLDHRFTETGFPRRKVPFSTDTTTARTTAEQCVVARPRSIVYKYSVPLRIFRKAV